MARYKNLKAQPDLLVPDLQGDIDDIKAMLK